MKVHFENVGRSKKTFTATIGKATHNELMRHVRPHLMSRDVEFATDPPNHNTGVIVVGGFQNVGTFRLELE